MYYVNTYQGFIPDRAVVPEGYEFVNDVRFAKGFVSFSDADQAGKDCLRGHGPKVQYYAVLGSASSQTIA